MEGRSTVEDRRPRNSYHRDRYVFAARAASACRRSWTAVGDDQRPIEGALPRQQHRDLIHIHFERVCRFITFVLITVAINHSFTLSLQPYNQPTNLQRPSRRVQKNRARQSYYKCPADVNVTSLPQD